MQLLKKNTKSLLKLSMVKFAYDNLLQNEGASEHILSILYHILRSKYWTDKSDPSLRKLSDHEVKRFLTKVINALSFNLRSHCIHIIEYLKLTKTLYFSDK